MELQSIQTVKLLTWPYGDWCIYCGKDAETCEHFDPADEAERNQ